MSFAPLLLSFAKKLFPGYEKMQTAICVFGSHTEQACERMRALPPPQEGLGSDLPLLLDRLFLMSGLTRKDALERLALPYLNCQKSRSASWRQSPSNTVKRNLPLINVFRKERTVVEAKTLQNKLQRILEYIQESIKDEKPIDLHMPHPDSTERARLLLMVSVNKISATFFNSMYALAK